MSLRALAIILATLALLLTFVSPGTARADVSPSVSYAYDSLRGLTGQAPDNDIGRWIVNTQNLFDIDIHHWWVQRWWRSNDHHLHADIRFQWRGAGGSSGIIGQTFHAYVDWPHNPGLRSYHDGPGH